MRASELLRSAPFRVAAYYAALFAPSVVVLFAVVLWASTAQLTGQLRATVQQEAEGLQALDRAEGLDSLRREVLERIQSARKGETFYLLLDANGGKLAGNVPMPRPVPGWQEVRADGPEAGRHSEGKALLLGTRITDGLLFVGRSSQPVDELREVLFIGLGWGVALAVLLALVGGVAMSRSALRRVEAGLAAAEEITQGNLSRRLPVAGTHDEIDRLADVINRMLDRIQDLMESLRQVTNDVAHEMRTPLGRLRQRLESARDRGRGADDYRAALERAITDVDGILETFSALLRIAQVESGVRRSRFASFDLSALAGGIVETFDAVAESREQRIDADIVPGVVVHGDRELITQALANVVENAIRHTPAGSRIQLALAKSGEGPVLTVADTGPGIPAEEHEKVLRRFYRTEQSRTTPGSGLGLALVKAVMDLHGGRVVLADNAPGLRVALRFPERDRL
jgi:signal transduction histidine kinase